MYCGRCGYQLNENDVYCPKCGEKISELIEEESQDLTEIQEELDRFEMTEPDSRKKKDIHRLRFPVFPLILSVILLLLTLLFTALLVTGYRNAEAAKTNLENNRQLKKTVEELTVDTDSEVNRHREIIEEFYQYEDGYSEEEIETYDQLLSELKEIEKRLGNTYDKVGEIYGEEYALYCLLDDDYTVEERDRALQSWVEIRQNSKRNVIYDDYLEEIDADVDQYVAEQESNIKLNLALRSCQLEEYDFIDPVNTSIQRAENEIQERTIAITILWIAWVCAAALLVLSIIKAITYFKPKKQRLSGIGYRVIAVLLLIFALPPTAMISGEKIIAFNTHADSAKQIQQEIEALEDGGYFLEGVLFDTKIGLSRMTYIVWENAPVNKANAAIRQISKDRLEELYILFIPIVVMLVCVTVIIDCIIKSKRKNRRKNTDVVDV